MSSPHVKSILPAQPWQRWLWNERPALFCYAFSALLAALFITRLFPAAFLAGHGAFFEQGDASQHVTGWLFYAHDQWHFPLLRTDRLNHPDGVSIVFTDSIPFAALLFKPIARWLPAQFHYIGLWHAFAFFTQAIAATFLIRTLGMRHLLGTLCATAFALTWPALLWRMGHTALLTHGVVLCALALYFWGRKDSSSGNVGAAALIVLCLVGLTIHPYFLAFCYALFLALLADRAIAGEGWKKQLPRLLTSFVALAATGVLLGYFGKGTTTFGFDYYSMNLTAPFCGGRFFSCASGHQFSAFHFADATGGQYEGYNYFGAGVLLLLPFAVASNWPAIKTLPRRYPALFVLAILFTVYALSSTIYAGSHKLASYTLPSFTEKITGTFRSSGRFFWIVGYLILFSTLAGLLKTPSHRSLILLALALPLQWFDVQPLQQRIVAKASALQQNDLAPWKTIMTGADRITVYPAFGCGDSDVNLYWFSQRLAAHYGKLLDTGYIARPNVDCVKNRKNFDSSFTQRQLAMISASDFRNPFKLPDGFYQAAQRNECVTWKEVVLCKAGMKQSDWQQDGLPVTPVEQVKQHAEWPGAALPTQIGTPSDGRMLASPGKSGFLTYGPYITLPPGRYHYAIRYLSQAQPAQQVGRWDIVADTNPVKQISSGTLHGTAGKVQQIDGVLLAEDWKAPLEIRTFFTGSNDLQLIDITLEKIRE